MDPNQCTTLIIGAGILGTACASYLSQVPGERVVLIDRRPLGSGTTSQAAALLGRAKSDGAVLDLIDETWAAIHRLRQEQDSDLGLRVVGSLHAGWSESSRAKLTAAADEARRRGQSIHWLTPTEARQKVPWLTVDTDAAAVFFSDDGYVSAAALAYAYYQQARRHGLPPLITAEVARIESLTDGRWRANLADLPSLTCDRIVLTGGPWTSRLTAPLGIGLAMAPVRSQYWITAPDPAITADMPVLVLPDARAYARPEVGGLLFGLRDQQRVHAPPSLLPDDIHAFCFASDPEGTMSLEEGYPALAGAIPLLERLSLSHYQSGVSSYTPDGRFLIGELEGAPGLWVATGCCGGGIGSSAGFGRLLSELIHGQRPFTDPAPFNPNRFQALAPDPENASFRLGCALAREGKISG